MKLFSEYLGYAERGTGNFKRYSKKDLVDALRELSLRNDAITHDPEGELTPLGSSVLGYLNQRAEAIERHVKPNLMNKDLARQLFEDIKESSTPRCALPMNKQTGEKRHEAYLTCIVNMLTEREIGPDSFISDPRGLTLVYDDGMLVRTFSRRMDGLFPNRTHPKAMWEIKEYYGTTTFGSRVADGVYETMLDGYEVRDLFDTNQIKIQHYLIVDDYFTWYDCGKSYLCRLIDILNMGLVDEILFGKEVLTRWPEIVRSWGPFTRSTITDRGHLHQSVFHP